MTLISLLCFADLQQVFLLAEMFFHLSIETFQPGSNLLARVERQNPAQLLSSPV